MSMHVMTKAEARAFRDRWARVNTEEVAELQRTSLAVRFEQLSSLMASASAFARPERDEEKINQVRARWRRLRSAYSDNALNVR